MSQEDKPVAEVLSTQIEAWQREVSALQEKIAFAIGKPVAAQEPVAKVLGALMTSGRSDKYAMESYKPLEVGALLYANAAPCAELQAKITEQAARIKSLEDEAADRESFIKTLADTCTEAERIAIERAGRIDALESECRKLRDALSELEQGVV